VCTSDHIIGIPARDHAHLAATDADVLNALEPEVTGVWRRRKDKLDPSVRLAQIIDRSIQN
jgi:hypothetical protein